MSVRFLKHTLVMHIRVLNYRKLALSHIVSRAVYPASELKTVYFMRENSSICELTGLIDNMITKYKLYESLLYSHL